MAEAWLTILGSSAAVPMRGRGLACNALSYRGSVLLLDVGEGCQHRLIEAGVSLHRVELVAVTHAHGDHVYGLPGLLQSMSMAGRTRPLTVVGPRQAIDVVRAVIEAGPSRPTFEVRLVEARDGLVVEAGGLRVRAFPVRHTVPAYGYVVEEPPRRKLRVELLRRLGLRPGPWLSRLREGEPVSVAGVRLHPGDVFEEVGGFKLVYTGDTMPCGRVVEEARGAAVLVHDSTFTSRHAERAYEEGHSTALDAAAAAREAGARLLVLTHFSARYDDVGEHVREARRLHPYVVAAEEFMRVPVSAR